MTAHKTFPPNGKRFWRSAPFESILALFLVFLVLAGGTARGGGTRLAIIGEPELEKETILLTAALSSHADLEILERAEIAKLLQEQRLEQQGLTTRDGVRLGALLKAHGLVLLERGPEEIRLRIVAVDTGAVVAFSSSQIPSKDVEKWSTLRAAEIASLAPKVALPKAEVLPISLMPINSAIGGTRGEVLEENIYSLLATRLSAAPKVIVLERARLQDAVAEKELAAENGAFWNSAWVIDGSVTEQPSGFSLDLRLQPPGGDAARRVQVEAPTLVGLVEEANGKILQTLGGSSKTWDSAGEARRFGDEALWAANNGFWSQAARAIEAAIALGESSPEMLRWRWQCYNRLARNRPGPQSAGGFNKEKGKDRPGAAQIRQMARSLELYHDAVAKKMLPPDAKVEERILQMRFSTGHGQGFPSQYEINSAFQSRTRFEKIPPIYDSEALGGLPDWEGCSLLRSATHLILAVEKAKTALDVGEEQALAELRTQIHELFDAMATTFPHLALAPSPDDRVPTWNSLVDPNTCVTREKLSPRNLYQTRLLYGHAWEKEPEGYYAFVRQCLASDLPQDPSFFQRVLHLITDRSHTRIALSQRTYDIERRKAGEALLADKSLRCQVAGAFILCKAGAPTLGLGLFERHKELFLNHSLSVDFITGAFRFDSQIEFLHEEIPGESRSKAASLLKDLIIYLMDNNVNLTTDMYYSLSGIQFTERQAVDLLATLKAYQGRNPSLFEGLNEGAASSLLRSLAHRAGLDTEPSVTSSSRAVQPPPSPQVAPKTKQPNSQSLSIDQAWVARNYDSPNASPGAIRYAFPQGEKLWLHVEFTQKGTKSIRRQFMTLDLPSLKSRVVFRDSMPETDVYKDRVGPTFACYGEGIYFWNGSGISYAKAKEVHALEVPELKRPFLWLVDGFLYAADEEGVIQKIDPATHHYEILASIRRRPPQNALDTDKDLREVTRIYRGANGATAVKIHNRKVYTWGEAKRDWTAILELNLDTPDLISAIDNGWDEGGRHFIGIHANGLLKKRAASRMNLTPAHDYLPEEDRANGRLSMVDVKMGVVSHNGLWSLIGDAPRFWLLKLDLDSGASLCRRLKFSPMYQAYTNNSYGPYKIIPTSAGVAIYEANEPVLWFLPAGDITPAPAHPKVPVVQ